MATIDKKDLRGVFTLLALVLLLGGIGAGIYIYGIVGFVVIAGLAYLSGTPGGAQLRGAVGKLDSELVFRVGVIVTLIGVLLLNYDMVVIGIIAGSMLMFSNNTSFTLDLMGLKLKGGSRAVVSTAAAAASAVKKKRKR